MSEPSAGKRPLAVTVSFFICVLVLAAGGLGMVFLLSLKEPPARAEIAERVLRVQVQPVQPEDVPVVMTGYGEVRATDAVTVVPEVAGRVIEVHPRLRAGEVIPNGEVLFRIDPSDYQASLQRAEGSVGQLQSAVSALRKQQSMDTEMLSTLKRTLELAEAEHARLKKLYEASEVGTLSNVERAEMARNQAKTAHDQLSNALDLYPTRIEEATSGLAAAQGALELARNALGRTTVVAPFNARVKMEQLEVGQVVAPGTPVAQLANDASLEIRVPLDSRDARQWLQFEDSIEESDAAWFSATRQVPCNIRWSEDPNSHVWQGTLIRVEAFDPQTRTLTVVVRLEGDQARSQDADRLPLVDGMFCNVEIPGKQMTQVYRVPRWAVTFEGDVYVAKGDRLEIRRAEIVRHQGEETILANGLMPGDNVIITRMVTPAPNSLLEIVEEGGAVGTTSQAEAEVAAGE